jgi:hypothetical protein
VDEMNCIKCGVAIEWAGQGRKPKYCVTHRAKTSDKITPNSRTARSTSKSLEVLRAELTQTLQGAGALLLAVDKYDGLVVIQGAPKLVDALITMAEVNPNFKKFLEGGAKSVVWIQLGTALAAIAVPIAAHHKLAPIDEVTAYRLFHGEIPAGVFDQPKPRPEPQPQPQPQPEPEPVVTVDDLPSGFELVPDVE